MTPLRLTSWFKARMLPLVAATALVVAAAAPTAFYLRERYDLVVQARERAARIGAIVRDEIDQRPTLWRYDATKLSERLLAAGLDRTPLRIRDADGAEVAVESPALPIRPLWARVDVVGEAVGHTPDASIWVAADQAPLLISTVQLGAGFALLALGLGAVLYLLPVRAIGLAERRIGRLLGRLTLTLQEEDRARIARELHDGAGQAITAARIEVSALRRGGADGAALARITRNLDEALDEVRRSTSALAPPALAELGLPRALRRHCEAFADAVGLEVRCEIDDELPPLDGAVETACYRIVQEALTNTARHAEATRAWVRITSDAGGPPGLRLVVDDNGRGIPGEGGGAGSGLEGVRERARLLGGATLISPREGGGLRLTVTLPLAEPSEPAARADPAPTG